MIMRMHAGSRARAVMDASVNAHVLPLAGVKVRSAIGWYANQPNVRTAAAAERPVAASHTAPRRSTDMTATCTLDDRSSIPAGPRVGSDGGGFIVDHAVEFEFDNVAVRHPAEAARDDAILIEDERGGCLQDVKTLGEIGPVGEVNIQVCHANPRVGNVAQVAVNLGAAGAEVSAELQDCRACAEGVFADELGPDNLGRKPAARAALHEARSKPNSDRQNEQHGDADQRI